VIFDNEELAMKKVIIALRPRGFRVRIKLSIKIGDLTVTLELLKIGSLGGHLSPFSFTVYADLANLSSGDVPASLYVSAL
jgi:hypothetical protein